MGSRVWPGCFMFSFPSPCKELIKWLFSELIGWFAFVFSFPIRNLHLFQQREYIYSKLTAQILESACWVWISTLPLIRSMKLSEIDLVCLSFLFHKLGREMTIFLMHFFEVKLDNIYMNNARHIVANTYYKCIIIIIPYICNKSSSS